MPGEGPAYDFHGSEVVMKATSAETVGQLAVMECRYPPGLAVPAHVHEGEDEMFYLLAGRVALFCEDDEWVATPGTFVFVPREHRHGFTVTGEEEARALVVVGPPSLDGQVATYPRLR